MRGGHALGPLTWLATRRGQTRQEAPGSTITRPRGPIGALAGSRERSAERKAPAGRPWAAPSPQPPPPQAGEVHQLADSSWNVGMPMDEPRRAGLPSTSKQPAQV